MGERRVLLPGEKTPESKVTAATLASYLLGVGGLVVVEAAANVNVLPFLPDWLQVLVAPLIPAVAAAVAGWLAPHTDRVTGETPHTH